MAPCCVSLWLTTFVYLLGVFINKPFVQAIRIRDCDPARWGVEVEDNSGNDPIVCEDFNGGHDMEWLADQHHGEGIFSLGTCSSSGVISNFNALFTLNRTSQATSSTFTFTNAQRVYGGYDIKCAGRDISNPTTPVDATCTVNIIYAARSGSTSCSITAHANKTMSGSCSMDKVFSSANYYACFLKQGNTQVTSSTYSVTPINSDTNYRTGTCSYSAPLPTTTGTFTYSVVVYPGAIVVPVSGTITVAAPTADPVITCTITQGQYFPENTNSNINCECSVSDLGQPQGRLLVYRGNTVLQSGYDGNSRVTFTVPSVNGTDKAVRCELDWITDSAQDRKTTYTFNVAYGPDVVSISGNPSVYERHPVSPSTLTLTCTALDLAPSVTYSWSRACSVSNSNTCSFIPTVNDNGQTVTCTATNTVVTALSRSTSVTLTVHYPPETAPVITGYTTGQVLYDQQSQSMTCSVTGGNPSVTSVTFSCGGQGVTSSQTSTSRVISITASPSLNGQTCECGANWKNKNPAWYTMIANVTVTVYYAPVTPNISHGNQRSPFLAGESATLVCSIPTPTDRGNPPATLTWQGSPGSTGQGESRLTFTSLNASHDNQKLVCEARNSFTVDNNSPVTAQFTLRVYYVAEVTFVPLSNNECVPSPFTTPTVSFCLVNQGHRVHLNCSALGNPPATVAWQQGGGSVLDLVANFSMTVEHTCNASTDSVSGDTRLPLSSSGRLLVFTRVAGVLRELSINHQSDNLTVNETHQVTVTCQGEGRPTPFLRLLKDTAELEIKGQGQPTGVEDTVTVSHVISGAKCEDAGTYRCEMGTPVEAARAYSLFVNCKPRIDKEPPRSVSYIGSPLHVPFRLVAFPAVMGKYTFIFLGTQKNMSDVVTDKDILTLTCDSDTEYSFNCIITVNHIGEEQAGHYSLTLENDFGTESVTFEVTVNVSAKLVGATQDSLNPAVVGGAVSAALVVTVAAVIVVAIVLYRRRKSPKQDINDMSETSGDDQHRTTRQSDDYELQEDVVHAGQNEGFVSDTAVAEYSSLNVNDIGKKSEYDEFSPYQNTGVHRGVTESASEYSSLRQQDIGLRSEYSQIAPGQKTSRDGRASSPYANVPRTNTETPSVESHYQNA